jgi:hypothetical protein
LRDFGVKASELIDPVKRAGGVPGVATQSPPELKGGTLVRCRKAQVAIPGWHAMDTKSGPKNLPITSSLLWQDRATSLFLFLATAAVVIWQNLRCASLWDLSYILETSHRISLGDVPYRDFPLYYPPLTFLIQAALMGLAGRVFFHHLLYCAIAGGLATVLTWRILLNLLIRSVASARLAAFLISLPLTVLGIYCIYPHPIYDSDCALALLVCIFLLQKLESKGFPLLRAFLTGAVLVVPTFIKQNVGLAFLGSAGLAFAILLGLEAWRRRPVAGYAWLIAGMVAGFASALLLIQVTAGVANYLHWTVQFAASVRMPTVATMLSIYRDHSLPLAIAAFVVGALLLRFNQQDRRALGLLGGAFISAPFIWPVESLFRHHDMSALLRLWPFVLIVSCGAALWRIWSERKYGFTLALPLILLITIHAAFLSQQVKGSTYALWPMLTLLIASMIQVLVVPSRKSSNLAVLLFAAVLAPSMLIMGGIYVSQNLRLYYVKLSPGALTRSTLPALRGLSIRGPWIPEFEELVRFANDHIPGQDGLLMIPGEDLFYYTTGRHPHLPVLMLDRSTPYSADDILRLSQDRGIRWLVVKKDLQRKEEPFSDQVRLLALLSQDFTLMTRLTNYDVYRHN